MTLLVYLQFHGSSKHFSSHDESPSWRRWSVALSSTSVFIGYFTLGKISWHEEIEPSENGYTYRDIAFMNCLYLCFHGDDDDNDL